jgi:hypothetical protein
MAARGGILLGAACAALLLAPTAQAHKLTAKKAEAALQPAADQMAPEVGPKIAALLPGATISNTSVDCRIGKKGHRAGHRAECSVDFAVAGASTGETVCSRPARVQFRSARSKKLKVSIAPVLACFFIVSLE